MKREHGTGLLLVGLAAFPVSRSPREPRAPSRPVRRLVDRGLLLADGQRLRRGRDAGHQLPHVDLARRYSSPGRTSIRSTGSGSGKGAPRLEPRRRARQRGRRDRCRPAHAPRAPTSWAATCSGRAAASGRRTGAAGGGPSPVSRTGVRLTHHAHEPIEMEGGTTFHFVTDGFDAAYAQALRRPATTAWTSRPAPPPFGRHSSPGSSTSSRSTSPRSCSGPASGSSTASDLSGWSPSRCCTRRWPRTSATAERAERRLPIHPPGTAPSLPMRTANVPLRASRKRIAELRNLGNVDLDRRGLWWSQSSRASSRARR